MLPICGVDQNSEWGRDAPDSCNITCIPIFFFFFVLLTPSLLLTSWQNAAGSVRGIEYQMLGHGISHKGNKGTRSAVQPDSAEKEPRVQKSNTAVNYRVRPQGLIKECPFFSLSN